MQLLRTQEVIDEAARLKNRFNLDEDSSNKVMVNKSSQSSRNRMSELEHNLKQLSLKWLVNHHLLCPMVTNKAIKMIGMHRRIMGTMVSNLGTSKGMEGIKNRIPFNHLHEVHQRHPELQVYLMDQRL